MAQRVRPTNAILICESCEDLEPELGMELSSGKIFCVTCGDFLQTPSGQLVKGRLPPLNRERKDSAAHDPTHPSPKRSKLTALETIILRPYSADDEQTAEGAQDPGKKTIDESKVLSIDVVMAADPYIRPQSPQEASSPASASAGTPTKSEIRKGKQAAARARKGKWRLPEDPEEYQRMLKMQKAMFDQARGIREDGGEDEYWA